MNSTDLLYSNAAISSFGLVTWFCVFVGVFAFNM